MFSANKWETYFQYACVLFLFLALVLFWVSIMMQSSRSESGHSSLISYLRGKSFSLLSVSDDSKSKLFCGYPLSASTLRNQEKEEKVKPKVSRIRGGEGINSRNQLNRKQQRKWVSEVKNLERIFEEIRKIDIPNQIRAKNYLLTFMVSVEKMTVHSLFFPLKIMSFVLPGF